MTNPPRHSPSGQNIDPLIHQNVHDLEQREEDRKQSEELDESKMSDSEYRESLREEYGDGAWADKVVDELATKRKETVSSRKKEVQRALDNGARQKK